MNQKLVSILLLGTFVGLTGCDKGGSDKSAAVPVQPERVYGASFNGVASPEHCDITSAANTSIRTVTCYQDATQFAPACSTTSVTYDANNPASLCQALINIRPANQPVVGQPYNPIYGGMNSCAQSAISQLQTRCNGTIGGIPQQPPIPGIPEMPPMPLPDPNDPNQKAFRCEFEAHRMKNRWFRVEIPKTTITFSVPNISQELDLRTKGLFNIGQFGRTTLAYSPSGVNSNMDSISLKSDGFNGRGASMIQTGFAGQPVAIEAESEDGSLRYSVNCVGLSNFKKPVTPAFKGFSCTGKSNYSKVNFTKAYDSSLIGSNDLGGGVTLEVSGDTNNKDNARLSLRTEGADYTTIVTSAYLKTKTRLQLRDSENTIDISCSPVY